MASVTRVNGLKATVGLLYNVNVRHFRVQIKDAGGSAVDIRAEDDAVDEACEQIIKEISPLAYFFVDDNTGLIIIVTDKSQSQTASDIQLRIRRLGTAVGPNNIDVSGSTVTVASAISNSIGGTDPVE